MGVDVENVWARLTVLPSMPPRMGLFTSLSEWLNRGIDPRPQMYDMAPTWRAFKAGLLQPGNPVQYPRLTGWALDVGRARDVRIIEAPEGRFVAEPPVVVEGELVDDHPAAWIERLARDGEAIVAVGEQGPDAFSSFAEWSGTWHMGVITVATYMSPRGVGVTP
ncbi:hypothetical protein [Nocardioides daeguensis]|uniref:Phage tail protein n=1 Tax=Nocardioides daeguensis TaxID=908359 RepID=A0ABP6USR2_9ACTN|nr:hypothetical protein [Nocardioides daeguensis]MBV6728208.1 hypothetical protein [Nocardioides daeguensis]MCR1773018.1 hypothetical protein [Nocardioides daeguensis]